MTARSLALMTLSLLTLVATDASSADSCSVAKKLSCIRRCPTVASCTAKATTVCPGGQCSDKEIRKGCKKAVAKCRAACRTPCLRSCEGQINDCVRAASPDCGPGALDELYPLNCDPVWKSCLAESATFCRQKACCTIPTRVEITETSCPEESCSCTPLVVAGRRWTYGAAGTASGPVGTRLLVNGYLTHLECGGWTSDEIPLQGPTCVRSAGQPLEITWTGTGPGIGPGLPGDGTGCYCSESPWPTVISAMATDGVEGQAHSDKDVTCP